MFDVSEILKADATELDKLTQQADVATLSENADGLSSLTDDEVSDEEAESGRVPDVAAEEDEESNDDDSDEEEESDEEDDEDSEDDDEIDYEAFYKALTAPIQMAGKKLSFSNPEEIVTLMQKGAGFDKNLAKMGKFKRHFEVLEQNELLDDSTLNTIVDVAKGDVQALKTFIDANDIDIYELLGMEESKYTPKKHVKSAEEFEASEKENEIKSLSGYSDIQTLVEEEWDDESRSIVLSDKDAAQGIIELVKSGQHDAVMAEAEKVKILASGDLTDIKAYATAYTRLKEAGILDKAKPKSTSNVDTDKLTSPKSKKTSQRKRKKSLSTKDVAALSSKDLDALIAKL